VVWSGGPSASNRAVSQAPTPEPDEAPDPPPALDDGDAADEFARPPDRRAPPTTPASAP
jgi:hypothetical protein